MTVADLILRLAQLPENAEVTVTVDGNELFPKHTLPERIDCWRRFAPLPNLPGVAPVVYRFQREPSMADQLHYSWSREIVVRL